MIIANENFFRKKFNFNDANKTESVTNSKKEELDTTTRQINNKM